MSWELFQQKLAIMRKINIMGVVFKLLHVSIWDAVKGVWQRNTATSFSFGVLSPSGEPQTKKVEPINCIKNATYRPHLVLHWCHFINGFSYLIDRSDIRFYEPHKFRFNLGLAQFIIIKRNESCVLLYYATKSNLRQAGFRNLRCGTFSAPHRFEQYSASCQDGAKCLKSRYRGVAITLW